jgi:hypothetical protein
LIEIKPLNEPADFGQEEPRKSIFLTPVINGLAKPIRRMWLCEG